MNTIVLGVTFVTYLCATFGMNLKSGIEVDPYAFYLTTTSAFIACVGIITYFNQKYSAAIKSGGVDEL